MSMKRYPVKTTQKNAYSKSADKTGSNKPGGAG